MAVSASTVLLLAVTLTACASAPPPPHTTHEDAQESAPDAPPPTTIVNVGAPERSALASTETYEEALSKPESLDVHDERVQLTDGQLTGPMRPVLNGCRIPSNARVTIKTAVQNGRAIGVTVSVRFERPKTTRPQPPQSRAAARYEAKAAAKISTCVDKAVRNLTWPPSKRRDSFTTEF